MSEKLILTTPEIMAYTRNNHEIIGHLGADPELNYTNKSETAVLTVNIATTDGVKRGGEWEDETNWHKVTFWGRLAEVLAEYAEKGTLVFVEGPVRTSNYTDSEGIERQSREVHARTLNILSGGSFNGDAAAYEQEEEEEDEFDLF